MFYKFFMGNNQIKEYKIENIISQIKTHKHYIYEDIKKIIQTTIISNNININDKTPTGETILLWCIGNLSDNLLLDVVNLLLEMGADPNLKGTFIINKKLYIFSKSKHYHYSKNKMINTSPLYALTRHIGNDSLYQTIVSLIMYGGKINFDITEFLYRYIFNNYYDYEIFKLLVENGLDIKSIVKIKIDGNAFKLTPIMLLSRFALENTDYKLKLDILKFMIDNESDLSYTISDNTKYNGITLWDLFTDENIKNTLTSYLESKQNNDNHKRNNLFIAKECLICYREDKDLCLTDCSHAVCCIDCISELPSRKCPYCNKNITHNNCQVIKFISS